MDKELAQLEEWAIEILSRITKELLVRKQLQMENYPTLKN